MDPMRTAAMNLVRDALERAVATGQRNANAMTLATLEADGAPSVRTVLARGTDATGVAFYTDTRSRKGRGIAADTRAAACFYWEPLEEQVSIEGVVEPIDDDAADADFATRPPGGRVLVHASEQSAVIGSDAALRTRIADLAGREALAPLPRPAHWCGHRLVPHRVEHWQGRRDRVHLRTVYRIEAGAWIRELLSP